MHRSAMWIMIAGPYRTGARSAEERAHNLRGLNLAASEVFRRGHIPVVGVNLALPIIETVGEHSYDDIMMPLSLAAADRCDGVLRLGGACAGADLEVERVRARGGAVFANIDAIPYAPDSVGMGSATPFDLASRLRRVYESFASGDPRTMTEFLADDVIYHLPGRHLGGGRLCGRDEVLARVATAARECDHPPRIQLLSVFAAGEFVVSAERFAAHRRGRMLDQEVCVIWRTARGQCVEIWSHFSDQDACDRFWA
jgi:ketosteroid isomerase-like protein